MATRDATDLEARRPRNRVLLRVRLLSVLSPRVHRQADAAAIRGVDEEAPLTPEVATLIRRLWEDEGIKQTFTKRSRFQITDSAS